MPSMRLLIVAIVSMIISNYVVLAKYRFYKRRLEEKICPLYWKEWYNMPFSICMARNFKGWVENETVFNYTLRLNYVPPCFFFGCEALETVILPPRVILLHDASFAYSYQLRNIIGGHNVRHIYNWTFYSDINLVSVDGIMKGNKLQDIYGKSKSTVSMISECDLSCNL